MGAKSWVVIGGGYIKFVGLAVVHQKIIGLLGWATKPRPKSERGCQAKTDLTGLENRSYRFIVFRGCWLGLAPSSSRTPVTAWTWQEKLVEVHEWNRVHRSNSWIDFLSSPIHSPSLVRRFGPSSGMRASYGYWMTLTSIRSKDGVPGTGFGSSTLWWKELPDVE
jgi:hypothetical protein